MSKKHKRRNEYEGAYEPYRAERSRELPYISDESVMREQAETRRKLQKFNTMDFSDYEGLSRMINSGENRRKNLCEPAFLL